ncbi:MAG: hypothetical protein GY774_35610 [Planctomycetes bacterium]|nr:hypothetical protein [Planctomycetota bacterium]
MDKIQAKIGDTIKGDQWRWAYTLIEDDGFKDSSFPGCQFRVHEDDKNLKIAVNIKTTGKPKWNGQRYQSRCKIEFVGDGEPSTFSGGTLYHID